MRIELGCRSTKAVAAVLRRVDPRRLEVVGAHAVRDVEGEDHRALALRQPEAHGRAREREADEPDRRREQREGDVAPPADAALRRRRHEPFGREPGGALGAQPQRPRVGEHEGRDAASQSSIHGDPSDISGAAACATR